ncbi:unnamed protein product [Caenorhabditis angaria]|uniref:Ig-like domain-containing protein n=1 Tax=Caenorhabditis angaria TaxID=860376 RepID=A0A9P1I7G4_9PELO|nr:unnamed protein product [Caenorhabditis angaria]
MKGKEICKSFWISNRPSQDCSSSSLQNIPQLLPNVLSLTLSNNSLIRIFHFPREYSRLQSIRLDQCKIEKIDYEALSTFEQLRELDLSQNRLSKLIIPRNLATLRVLNLAFNSFTYVPDMSHLNDLQLVDLSHNQIISVRPRMLPFNLEVIRMSANRFTHLTPWPFLNKLQELDVSFNSLQCDCSLYNFVNWAETLSLFDISQLPCRQPSELRKKSDRRKNFSLKDHHTMCCQAFATPSPQLYWQLNGKNISNGLSQKHLSDSGQVEFCFEIREIGLKDLGTYKCLASLAGINSSVEFHLERDKIPIVLNSAEGIMIYCQFTICTFIGVCCIISCCVLRTGGKPKKPRQYLSAKILEVPQESCEFCEENTTNSSSNSTDFKNNLDFDSDWKNDRGGTVAVRHYLEFRRMEKERQEKHMNIPFLPHFDHEHLCRLSKIAPLAENENEQDEDEGEQHAFISHL